MKAKWLMITTGAAGIITCIVQYFFLPENVAMHFNLAGTANSWGSRLANLVFWIVLYLLMNLLWLLVPVLVKKLPASLVNIPNRDYWLAPERKESTGEKIAGWMYGFGIIINIFIVCISFVVLIANMAEGLRLNVSLFFIVFSAFMITFIIWLILFVKAFMIKKGSNM